MTQAAPTVAVLLGRDADPHDLAIPRLDVLAAVRQLEAEVRGDVLAPGVRLPAGRLARPRRGGAAARRVRRDDEEAAVMGRGARWGGLGVGAGAGRLLAPGVHVDRAGTSLACPRLGTSAEAPVIVSPVTQAEATPPAAPEAVEPDAAPVESDDDAEERQRDHYRA